MNDFEKECNAILDTTRDVIYIKEKEDGSKYTTLVHTTL